MGHQGNGKLANKTLIERMGKTEAHKWRQEIGRKGGSAPRRTALKQVETEAKDTANQHKSWKSRLGL